MKRHSPYLKVFAYGLILIPIFFHFLTICKFSLDIPYSDDFRVLLEFFSQKKGTSLQDFALQHNEHRPFLTRMLGKLSIIALGSLNFKFLILLGNAALIGILLILSKTLKDLNIKVYYILPVSYLLFFSISWENSTWSLAATQNYFVLLFALISFYIYSLKRIHSILFSFTFAFLGCYTSGSGLLICLTLLLWCILELSKKILSKKDYPLNFYKSLEFSNFAKSLIFTLLIFIIYFHDYIHPEHHQSTLEGIRNFSTSVKWFLTLHGGNFSYFYAHEYTCRLLAIPLGLFLISLFAYFTFKKYYLKYPFLFYSLVFLTGNTLLASLTRSNLGIEIAFSSRYKMICALILSISYILLLTSNFSNIQNNRLIQLIIFFVLPLTTFPNIILNHDVMLKTIEARRNGFHGWAHEVDNYYMDANKSGIYYKPFHQFVNRQPPQIYYNIDVIELREESLRIAGWVFQNQNKQEIFKLVINTDKNAIQMPLKFMQRPDVSSLYNNNNLINTGFESTIPISFLQNNTISSVEILVSKGTSRVVATEATKKLNHILHNRHQ